MLSTRMHYGNDVKNIKIIFVGNSKDFEHIKSGILFHFYSYARFEMVFFQTIAEFIFNMPDIGNFSLLVFDRNAPLLNPEKNSRLLKFITKNYSFIFDLWVKGEAEGVLIPLVTKEVGSVAMIAIAHYTNKELPKILKENSHVRFLMEKFHTKPNVLRAVLVSLRPYLIPT